MPSLLIYFSILKKLLYLKEKLTYFSNLSTAKKLNQIINS